MLGNFSYCNPTKLYFGEDSLQYLKANGKEIFEDAGVMSNPTVEKLNEGDLRRSM